MYKKYTKRELSPKLFRKDFKYFLTLMKINLIYTKIVIINSMTQKRKNNDIKQKEKIKFTDKPILVLDTNR